MKRLLQIEAIKTLGYPVFRAIIILHFTLFLLVALVSSNFHINIQGVSIEKLFVFPHIWSVFAWFSSWFNLLLGILAIILISNEFQFRTFRKQLIDGLTRNDLLYGKLIVFVIVALYTMILVFVSGLIFGIINSSNFTVNDFFEGLYYLPILFVQALAYTLLAMLFAFFFRNAGLSIVMFVLFFFLVEPIIRWFLPGNVDKFLPVKIIANLTPMPNFFDITLGEMVQIQSQHLSESTGFGLHSYSVPLWLTVVVALIYSVLFILVSSYIIKRKNF
ncbi:MAG TPA: ABC transporter permease [Tenuifilaceae bacterium]|nr:ABC transporter permease [Tenuifilaceae bacterium]HPE17817.1 ABC transporter permease [Tenuifilaceae bacterium]HPJ45285.1 ABC transporter permease [Tenuifilaceae bacterium]HPQ33633.1 ABC transporter permease [Tenuifilaceae bacterium]HRX67301.1 ABC transporter permease [Tenuifilaceae bacterium]